MPKMKTYVPKSRDRIRETYNKRKHLEPRTGRQIPRLEQLQLGESRDFEVAICQLDIADSTKMAESLKDRRRWAVVLSIFLTEMTYVLRDHGGELDKYTGDGGMIVFGVGEEKSVAVKNAVDFCLTMFTVTEKTINPFLASKGLPSIEIKAGIDYGKVLIERLGIRGTNDLLIIGATANMAAKLEDRAKTGKLIIGHNVLTGLSQKRQNDFCTEVKFRDWNYKKYRTYEYTGRWT